MLAIYGLLSNLTWIRWYVIDILFCIFLIVSEAFSPYTCLLFVHLLKECFFRSTNRFSFWLLFGEFKFLICSGYSIFMKWQLANIFYVMWVVSFPGSFLFPFLYSSYLVWCSDLCIFSLLFTLWVLLKILSICPFQCAEAFLQCFLLVLIFAKFSWKIHFLIWKTEWNRVERRRWKRNLPTIDLLCKISQKGAGLGQSKSLRLQPGLPCRR